MISKWYTRDLSQKCRKAHLARFRAGLWPHGRPPFGYRYDTGEKPGIIIDPNAAQFVRLAFDTYAGGDCSYGEVALRVIAAGYPKRIAGSLIQKWLRRETYAGRLSHKGETREGIHEPIVSRRTFDRCAKIMAARANGNRHRAKRVRPFTGMLRCRSCGQPVVYRVARKTDIYLLCRASCGHGGYQRAANIDARVLALLARISIPDGLVAEMLDNMQRESADYDATASVRKRLAAAEKQRSLLYDVIGELDYDEVIARINKVDVEIASLREELVVELEREDPIPKIMTVREAAELLRQLPTWWGRMAAKEQREILHILWVGNHSTLDTATGQIEPVWQDHWVPLVTSPPQSITSLTCATQLELSI